jgi:hypothetical protein
MTLRPDEQRPTVVTTLIRLEFVAGASRGLYFILKQRFWGGLQDIHTPGLLTGGWLGKGLDNSGRHIYERFGGVSCHPGTGTGQDTSPRLYAVIGILPSATLKQQQVLLSGFQDLSLIYRQMGQRTRIMSPTVVENGLMASSYK